MQPAATGDKSARERVSSAQQTVPDRRQCSRRSSSSDSLNVPREARHLCSYPRSFERITQIGRMGADKKMNAFNTIFLIIEFLIRLFPPNPCYPRSTNVN